MPIHISFETTIYAKKKSYMISRFSFKMNFMKLAKAKFKNLMSTYYFHESHYFCVTDIAVTSDIS